MLAVCMPRPLSLPLPSLLSLPSTPMLSVAPCLASALLCSVLAENNANCCVQRHTHTHTHAHLQTAVCRYTVDTVIYADTATDTFVSASAPDNFVSTKANVRVVHLFNLLTTVVVPRPLSPPLLDQLYASGCRCTGWARGGVAAAILISRTAMYRQVLFSRSCLLLLCI